MPSDLPRPPGDAAGRPEPLARLADVLAEAGSGVRPTPRELAELLWLAARMDDGERAGPQEAAEGDVRPPHHPGPPRPTAPPGTPGPPPDPGPRASPPEEPPRAPLHLPSPRAAKAPAGPSGHVSLLAPAPPMLRHPLGLQRALRPLKRRTDAPAGRELDERATAERIARLGADPEWWLPVLRPAQERWLRLHLVHDTGPTMPVWRPLVAELHTALAQSGVFRTVAVHRARPDGTVDGHTAPTPADGRTVVLLISDCMGPQWREGPAAVRWYATLRGWARRMPLAVVQPLPEHLWRDTALPTAPGRLTPPHPAAPSASLVFTPYDTPEDPYGTSEDPYGAPRDPYEASAAPYASPGAGLAHHGIPLPVLEPEPGWLANWASLIASTGGTRYPAAVAFLGAAPPGPEGLTDLAGLSPEDLVLRFRAMASPEAFRLAGHLALGRPDLPVMRLVHAALEPDPRPQHLAEIILSGLLTSAGDPAGSYAFRPGVRELLLRAVPRTDRLRTTDLLERVGALIDTRAGRAPGEFLASAPAEGGTGTAPDTEAFATVSTQSVRQLAGRGPVAVPAGPGGRYRLQRRLARAGTLWQALDPDGRPVALRLLEPVTDPARRKAFLRDARRLRELDHPNVTAVHDAGFDGDTPYVVMEHLDGIPLNSLAAPNGYRLPAPLLVSLGPQLARGLQALHETGVTHGALGMARVMLLPDGRAVLSPFEPGGWPGREHRTELRWLGEMLQSLAAPSGLHTGPAGAGPADGDRVPLLPDSARTAYARALDALIAERPEGQDLLTDPLLTAAAHAAYEPRAYLALGPLRVEGAAARDLPEGGPALLTALLTRHGRVVTHDELRAALWDPGEEPGNALAALGATASRLRTFLGPAAALATRPDGYALHISADQVDVVQCEAEARDAEEARLAGDLPAARAHIARALKVWRPGEPLADVPGPGARTARGRLLRLRLDLCRTRAELDLDLGEVDRAAADLADLVGAHPAREDFRRLYLTALRRQGRTERALEVAEEYERSGGRDPGLLELGRELREGTEHGTAPHGAGTPALTFVTAPLTGRPEARITLEYAVHETLARGALSPQQYEVEVREDGYAVRIAPDAGLLPVLVAALRTLPEALAELRDAPQVRVAFRDAPVPSARPALLVAVPPALYEEFAASSAARGPQRFRPLYGAVDSGPLSWYCPLPASKPLPEEDRDLVRGPLIAQDPRETGLPDTGRTAVVHAPPDRPLTLLTPARPDGAGALRATTYYEVDLTPHEASRELRLPSSGKEGFTAAVELSWHVTDPVAFVHGGPPRVLAALLEHLTKTASRLTRRHSLRHAAGAGRAVGAALREWPVPGLAVTCAVRLVPAWAPAPPRAAAAPRGLRELLLGARTVLVGFDGPLARLFSAQGARDAALDLLALVAEHRDPEESLSGRPLRTGAPQEAFPHPLDVLRAFAHDRYGPLLRSRLDVLELAAVPDAPLTHRSAPLVRALHAAGRRVEVVTDVCEEAAERFLEPHALRLPGVHGRAGDLGLLMPAPDCLLRALDAAGRPASAALLLTSSPAEVTAARRIGLPCVGLGRSPTVEGRLREAGCDLTVPSLEPVLEAARAL
ncbi:SAV_2336 N-terminal domain-related protein [Streptomyces sp. NPDC093094]|uniref:SAV_2336 N-terminal domain-related protein n=1 Tax=Streptomyces sp. NPDC093094 TaxID=3366026 RepID=UPI003820556A